MVGLPVWLTVLVQILSVLPWGELLKMFMDLVGERQKEIDKGLITGDQARETNIEIMRERTATSKPVPEPYLRMFNEIAVLLLSSNSKMQEFGERIVKYFANFWTKYPGYKPEMDYDPMKMYIELGKKK